MASTLIDGFLSEGEGNENFFSQFEEESGISLGSVEYVEAFLDLGAALSKGGNAEGSENGAGPAIGAAFHGPFDEEELIAKFKASIGSRSGEGYEVENYRGFEIYRDSSGDADSFVLSSFDSDTILLGTIDGVKAMLDVAAGETRPFTGEAVQSLNALGDRDVGVVMRVSPEMLEEMSGATQDQMGSLAALNPTALTAPLTVGIIRFDGQVMELVSQEFFDDEDTAVAAKEYTEGSAAMFGAMLGSPEIQEVLASLEATRDGRVVTQSLTMDAEQMEKILEFLFGFLAMEVPES